MTSASLSISSTTGSVNSPRSLAGSSTVPLAEPPTSKSRSSAMLPTSAVTLLPPESCAERAGFAGGLGGAARRRHRRSRKAPIRTWVRPSPCGNLLHHSRLNSIMHEWPNSGTPGNHLVGDDRRRSGLAEGGREPSERGNASKRARLETDRVYTPRCRNTKKRTVGRHDRIFNFLRKGRNVEPFHWTQSRPSSRGPKTRPMRPLCIPGAHGPGKDRAHPQCKSDCRRAPSRRHLPARHRQ